MDGQQRPAQPAGSNMIRPEQVVKLPQLNASQKQQFTQHVQKLWQIITDTVPNDPKYAEAQQRLIAISQSLMHGMKQFRAASAARAAQMQAQAQAQAQAAAAAAGQGQQNQGQGQSQGQQQQPAQSGVGAPSQSTALPFHQLMPEIQAKVNEQHFFFPPAIAEGTKAADDWLREAKARFGQALQRAQLAKTKKLDFQRSYQQRESQGNPLNPQEREVYQNKLIQCNKAIAESQSFMDKFKEQQATFQKQQAQQRFPNPGINPQPTETAPEPPAVTPTVVANAQGAPNAHSITSAVNAARNAAALAAQHGGAAASPAHGQVTGPAQTPTTAHNPLNSSQSPVHQSNPVDHSRPTSAHPGQSATHQQSSTPHANPLNSLSVKPQGPSITKNLVVSELKPVQMPPSRPTLNGGAGVGLPGQLAQPALVTLPGFVLETSEDGRVLSKKKLNELVREVCGPSPEDQLTPEAEEIFLQIADDFVDDLIQASCKLAKLRGSNTLEPRDIMVVLERQYNIRIPGFSTDEVRTVRRTQPAPGWAHKMSAVQAAKLTGGGSTGQALGSSALQGKD